MNDTFIAEQLSKIFDKQIEQGERLARIETNHTNLNSMLEKVNNTLDEISKTDAEQSEKIEAVSVKTDSIEETLKEVKRDQKKMDERIQDLESRLSVEEATEKGAGARYEFLTKLTEAAWFKWVLLGIGILLIGLISGRTDFIINLIERVIT